MLTLRYIIRRTPKKRREDAQYVRILKSKAGYDAKGRAFFAAQTQSTHERNAEGRIVRAKGKNKYVTVITILSTKTMAGSMSCSCGDFTFRWETALHDKDAANIEYSNGEQPLVTNPSMIPAVCKHLVRVYNEIESKLVPRK